MKVEPGCELFTSRFFTKITTGLKIDLIFFCLFCDFKRNIHISPIIYLAKGKHIRIMGI